MGKQTKRKWHKERERDGKMYKEKEEERYKEIEIDKWIRGERETEDKNDIRKWTEREIRK